MQLGEVIHFITLL